MKLVHPAFPEIVRHVTKWAAWRDAGWLPVTTTKADVSVVGDGPGDPVED